MEGDGLDESDGKEALVEILSQSDRSTEEKIITGLTLIVYSKPTL